MLQNFFPQLVGLSWQVLESVYGYIQKKSFEILNGIALNLQTKLERTDILILNLPIHKHMYLFINLDFLDFFHPCFIIYHVEILNRFWRIYA